MRLLALPALAVVVLGSGVAAEQTGSEPATARAAKATLAAGSARFAVSAGSVREAGVIDLEDETAVLDRGDMFSTHSVYQPIPRREAEILAISDKRWVETETGAGYSLAGDPLLMGTRGLFRVIARAENVRALGRGDERRTLVLRYSARVPLDAFLAELPPFEQETFKPGDGGPESLRDYLVNYFHWDEEGQSLEFAIDAQDRIRRVRIELLIGPVTVELYDYGVGVEVAAPPTSEVISSRAYEQLKSDYCSELSRRGKPRKEPCL